MNPIIKTLSTMSRIRWFSMICPQIGLFVVVGMVSLLRKEGIPLSLLVVAFQ
jgi:hypothetical protein